MQDNLKDGQKGKKLVIYNIYYRVCICDIGVKRLKAIVFLRCCYLNKISNKHINKIFLPSYYKIEKQITKSIKR